MIKVMRMFAGGLAAAGLAVAAAVSIPPPSPSNPGASLWDTLVLLRWGHGALDAPQPESTGGEAHVGKRHHRP